MGGVDAWDVDEASLKAIRAWVSQKENIPSSIPDDLLATFLHSCYSNLDKTKKAIETYFKMKVNATDFFENRQLDDETLKKITSVVNIFVLPAMGKNDCPVIWGRLHDTDPSKTHLELAIKFLFMVIDTVLQEWPGCPGIYFVYDAAGVSFGHLLRISISTVKNYFEYIQEGMPVRLRGIHVLNVSPIMTNILALIRPFMHKEHVKTLFLHTANQVEDTYEDVPLAIMPQEYGGNSSPIAAIQDDTLKKLKAHGDWFKMDESLRLETMKLRGVKSKNDKKSTNDEFKKLTID